MCNPLGASCLYYSPLPLYLVPPQQTVPSFPRPPSLSPQHTAYILPRKDKLLASEQSYEFPFMHYLVWIHFRWSHPNYATGLAPQERALSYRWPQCPLLPIYSNPWNFTVLHSIVWRQQVLILLKSLFLSRVNQDNFISVDGLSALLFHLNLCHSVEKDSGNDGH